ncbi:NADPH oxidase 5, partial [Acipenser ruthenus]
IFYWTHLCYIWVWALLVIHGPSFWKWFCVPGFVFLLEKIVGIAVSRMGGLYIVEVNLLPSKVTHLVIRRPLFFNYKPGDYVYINIPVIAKYEWHPFTISSAPEQHDSLWLHIRSMGQWTNRLYEYFRQPEPMSNEPKRLTTNLRNRQHQKCTQFSSLVSKYRMRKQNCPNCNYSWCENLKDNEMKLRKVDFIWINRDQKSFEWFVSLLTKLEMDQADEEPEGRFLEMHMYMTSALCKNDMKAIGLQMALDLLAKKENRDSITGLRTRTQPGRPDWSKILMLRRCLTWLRATWVVRVFPLDQYVILHQLVGYAMFGLTVVHTGAHIINFGSGSIDPDELRTVLKSCLRESAISLPEEKLDDLTLALFESADKDNSGSITFEELKEELENFPEVMENLTISAANWLKPPDSQKKRRHTPRYLTRAYWHNNCRKLLFMGCYVCLNILLFTFAALKHTTAGFWVMVAKGCGQCLNFNCTFIVVSD